MGENVLKERVVHGWRSLATLERKLTGRENDQKRESTGVCKTSNGSGFLKSGREGIPPKKIWNASSSEKRVILESKQGEPKGS